MPGAISEISVVLLKLEHPDRGGRAEAAQRRAKDCRASVSLKTQFFDSTEEFSCVLRYSLC
jgi:hypothetical protein